MRAFLCHRQEDNEFVLLVKPLLEPHFDHVFAFEHDQLPGEDWRKTVVSYLERCEVMIIFVGNVFTENQRREVALALDMAGSGHPFDFFVFTLPGLTGLPDPVLFIDERCEQPVTALDDKNAAVVRDYVVDMLSRKREHDDGLPRNPHIFAYEKDMVDDFAQRLVAPGQDGATRRGKWWLDGCPDRWPEVPRLEREPGNGVPGLDQEDIGKWRPLDARVVVAALTTYLNPEGPCRGADHPTACMINNGFCFPEAGPRETLYFPARGQGLRAAVLVAGGIAPGVNAVIDGIVQRHYLYDPWNPNPRGRTTRRYQLEIRGLPNGFRSFFDSNLAANFYQLLPDRDEPAGPNGRVLVSAEHANEGGSMIGTSRLDELINGKSRIDDLEKIVIKLFADGVDILYVIGGDGSMKAAHALSNIASKQARTRRRHLSVIAIPKTMDNDVLWVWQSFGFLSAVEKAREVIEHLATEVTSNPRICVLQLFGSDSGFVVSHAILATKTGTCDVALVPEVDFSIGQLAEFLRRRIAQRGERMPRALVVMAETAVPTDVMEYLRDHDDVGLSILERRAIEDFDLLRREGRRIQGQTDDALRTAGLKIVCHGLRTLLPSLEDSAIDWEKMRVFVNEPRHVLRAIPPSCSDIIMGQRLGTLAVDSALAGYTDCMISQWLTEYVLVPLELVVMGRKRIPSSGMFWKSVIAKTGQPASLALHKPKEPGAEL